MKLQIINADNTELFSATGAEIIDCVYNGEYSKGDTIVISGLLSKFVRLQLDETLKESIVYTESTSIKYEIPEERNIYAGDAFSGSSHRIVVAEATEEEAYGYRNIALNPHDKRGQKRYFPHAYANLVTRDASCFFERNAIDGVIHSESHGDYPYHSWAGGAREDLEYYIDFGQEVEVEKIVFFLRADFPHDTYWKNIDKTDVFDV